MTETRKTETRKSDWLVSAQMDDPTIQPCTDCEGTGRNCSTCRGFGY